MRGGWSVFLPHSPLGSLIWRSSVEHRARQGWKMSLNGSTARPDRVVYLKSRVVSCRGGRIPRSWLHVCQDRSVVGSPAWQITPTGFQATCTRHMKSSVMLKDLHYYLWSHALRRCDGTSLTYWEEGFSTRPYICIGHLSCILFVCWHMKFKECLEFEQSVVEKLPSFVKLVQYAYKSAFLVRFVVSLILHICSWRSSLVAWLW